MLRELLSESQWGDVREFVSPKIFKVVPFTKATGQFRRVTANYFDQDGFEQALIHRGGWLEQKHLPIQLTRQPTVPLGDGALGGRQVIELYFHQLFYGDIALLDLRYERFGGVNGTVEWAPQPFYYAWNREFQEACRQMYLGFYLGDDALFDEGMATMGLSCAEDIFLEHFGGGEQHAVSFQLDQFMTTFRRTLRRCKAEGERVHPNMIPFGMYIVTLYDHLEKLGGAYDVRAAFFEAVDVDEAEW
jgi:hypothetical protein